MEYAFEGQRLAATDLAPPSIFTDAVVQGLRTGAADLDEDGLVSLDEFYDYVYDEVKNRNPAQTPNRSFDLQGPMYIARSKRRRIRAAPLPAELESAVRDPNPFTRRGAVSELRLRLASPALPVAKTALDALRQLAEQDVESVSRAARAALDDKAPAPRDVEVDLGDTAGVSGGMERRVPLAGPALARAVIPGPSPPWLHVRVDQDVVVTVNAVPGGPPRTRLLASDSIRVDRGHILP